MQEAPTAQVIDGRKLAKEVRESVRSRVAALHEQGRKVRLDAVLTEGDAASALYAANQQRTCESLGISYVAHRLSANAAWEDVAGRVLVLNEDDRVHAIMVHLPLPAGIPAERVQALIDVEKDVEGVNPANIGNIVYGRRSLVPCTALAVMEMIEAQGLSLRGAHCVVVGASNIVGKPIAVLLMREEATVVSTNRYTRNLGAVTREADVLIAAAGVPELVRADMVKRGAIVIDVGVNQLTSADGTTQTVGDVATDEVAHVARALSPVPGGVGPMTVAMLLRNTVESAERRAPREE